MAPAMGINIKVMVTMNPIDVAEGEAHITYGVGNMNVLITVNSGNPASIDVTMSSVGKPTTSIHVGGKPHEAVCGQTHGWSNLFSPPTPNRHNHGTCQKSSEVFGRQLGQRD